MPRPAIIATATAENSQGAVSDEGGTVSRPFPPTALGWETRLQPIDDAVLAAIQEKKLPGCVVVVGRRDRILLRRAYGERAVVPSPLPMTLDTVFDLASLTKPLATAASILVLEGRGAVDLDEPAAVYVPAFAENGKSHITLRHLLTHTAGLPADTPVKDYEAGRDEALRRIYKLKPRAAPGERFNYSDVGFMVLEEVVRRVSGEPLDAFAEHNVFSPLRMTETGFLPRAALRARAAPTEFRISSWMQGEVHDPRAYLLGGVAGHAGVFSTGDDVARFAQAILNGGELDGTRFLSSKGVSAFIAPHDVRNGVRALGWDVRSTFSGNRATGFSARAVGHGGFTGTSLWIDPELDLFVAFLSNRVHPDGKGSVNPLIRRIGDVATSAVASHDATERIPRPEGEVRTGIDVLEAEGFARLAGAHMGLITNVSGRTRHGAMTLDVLRKAEGTKLVALFAPEHGLMGSKEGRIENGSDPVTGLPIYSLYGESLRPTEESLAGIDTLVFDIQDVGTRYYTYISTMRRAMESAAAAGLRFIVLDRPNPIGGIAVEGPVLAPGMAPWLSPQTTAAGPHAGGAFVNHHPLPIRHGMTAGELALLFDADLHLGTNLQVIRVEGWNRQDYFDATGLPFVNPSPNLRNVTEELLYPAIGLLESTNVSVGRGTKTPFEVLGAPWVDGAALANALTAEGLLGVTFEPTTFVPDASIHQGLVCSGVRVTVTSRATFAAVRTGLAVARALHHLYPNTWKLADLDKLVAHTGVMEALRENRPLVDIEAAYDAALQEFRKKRERYLLYPLNN